jgi:NAD(P)H-dependent FMN reductase
MCASDHNVLRPLKVAIVSTSLSPHSRSRALAVEVARELRQRGCDLHFYDARSLPSWLCRDDDDIPEEYSEVKREIAEMDAVIIAFPVYLFAPSGAAKNFIDIVGEALIKKPLGFLCASGSLRSYLSIRDVMSSLIFEFEAYIYPKFIHLDEQAKLNEISGRIPEFCDGFEVFSHCLLCAPSVKLRRVGVV